MASIINAATSGGLISTGDTSGQLQLQTVGTTALTVTSAQKIGVGTSSPTTILQVSATTPVVTVTGTSTTASSQDFTTNSATQRTTIGVEQSAGGGLFVGSSAYAAVFGSAGASSTQFATNNTVRTTIDTSGNFTFNTSNAGIIFNNSSALTNSTLNDYETGTWTPVVTSGVGSLTSYTSAGSYIKIGQFVFVRFTFTITSAGSSSGDAGVAGLPFSTTSNSYTEGTNLVREDGVTGTFYGSRVANSSTSLRITALTGSGAIVWSNGYAYGGTLSYQTTN